MESHLFPLFFIIANGDDFMSLFFDISKQEILCRNQLDLIEDNYCKFF